MHFSGLLTVHRADVAQFIVLFPGDSRLAQRYGAALERYSLWLGNLFTDCIS
jgi:hypothetical protein